MSYTLKEQLAAAGNHGGTRRASDIRYLVLHYTGNTGDTAAANAAYFQRSVVKASAHYFVDDTTVYRSVPDLTVAWAVGGTKWADCAQTGGGAMYGKITNSNSLSVELCGTAGDGRASEATQTNAAELCRKLMAQYSIPIENVYRHFDVTGKHCPRYWMDALAWQTFKARLKTAPAKPDDAFCQQMELWLAQRAAELPSAASEAARRWAEDAGIVTGFSDGSRQYRSYCTREQTILMLYRLWKLLQT